jgi:uncharacterized phage protein (TIGR02218 family)
MKTIDAGTRAMIDSRVITLAWGMKLIRGGDGEVSGWTDFDRPRTVTVGGSPLLLDPQNSVLMSQLARTAGFAVDNTEVSILEYDDYMTKVDVYDGLWDNTEFFIFEYDWATPSNAIIPHIAGTFGVFTPGLDTFKFELHDWRRNMQQDTTRVTQAGCDEEFGGPRCRIDLAPFTFAGTVTSVASEYTFTASALGNPAGTFEEGNITWLTGLNAGRSRKVRTHTTGGVLTLMLPALREIQIGDTFTIVAGCARTREACKAKGNILNYQGFDQKATVDALTGGAVIES